MVLLQTPEIGTAWSNLQAALERSGIPRNLAELSILIVAREWNCQFAWYAHEGPALAAGVSAEMIDTIRNGRSPYSTVPMRRRSMLM